MEVQSPNSLKNKCWSAGVACNNSALTILKQTIRKFSFKPIIASSVLMKKRGKLLKNGAFIFKLPKEEKKRKIIEKWRIHIQIAKRGKSCQLASTNVREKKSRCEMMFSTNPIFCWRTGIIRQNCLDTTLDMNLGNVFYRNRESFYHRRLNEIVNLHVKLRDDTLCFFLYTQLFLFKVKELIKNFTLCAKRFRFKKYSKQEKRQKHWLFARKNFKESIKRPSSVFNKTTSWLSKAFVK